MVQDCKALLKLFLEKNIVKYLLMGKAISKAIRGNFLAESALNIFHVTIANFFRFLRNYNDMDYNSYNY